MLNNIFFKGCVTVLLFINIGFAQTKIVEFSDALCSYRGHYDSRKFTERQLLNTYTMFERGYSVDDSGTLTELTTRSDSVIRELTALDIVDDVYFKKLKEDILRYVKQTQTLKKIQKTAQQKPEGLLSAVQKDSKAWHYAKALNSGGEPLLNAYQALVKIADGS